MNERKRKAFETRFRRLLGDMVRAGVAENDGRDVFLFFESGYSLNVADADAWNVFEERESHRRPEAVLFSIDTGRAPTGCGGIDCGAW